jgi:hypothetical protein
MRELVEEVITSKETEATQDWMAGRREIEASARDGGSDGRREEEKQKRR